jgi:hypothetical protein
MQYKAISLSLALALAAPLAWGEASVADYRAALADKDANPGFLIVDRGEMLFKEKRGPKNASLEKCDFGLGAGKLKGAYAQLPRYFKDTKRVQDLESRLMTCMTTCRASARLRSSRSSMPTSAGWRTTRRWKPSQPMSPINPTA